MLRTERDAWETSYFEGAEAAWRRIQAGDVDVVVTDHCMPGLTGLELLQRVRESPSTDRVAVIIVTGSGDKTLKRQALDLGATDLLTKPIEAEVLIARIHSALKLKRSQDALCEQNDRLEHLVAERTQQLTESRTQIVWRLAKAGELRDEDTGNHVFRVGLYSRQLAAAVGLPRDVQETLFLAAPLHDIGKIGIPDAILRKPGPLTSEERALMQAHCEIGERILSDHSHLEQLLRGPLPSASEADPLLHMAFEIAGKHHEWWNGHGYPRRLAGVETPLCARIVSITDVFDALTSARSYKSALPPDEALRIIRNSSGTQFEPGLVDTFLDLWPGIEPYYNRFRDAPRTAPAPALPVRAPRVCEPVG